MTKFYALVKDGKVIEYPVTEVHIRNRKKKLSDFVECVINETPPPVPFHFVKEKISVIGDKVYVQRTSEPIDLQGLISMIYRGVVTQTRPGQQTPKINIQDIDPKLVLQIKSIAVKEVQQKLDAFARGRGFDDIATLITYKNSTIEAWVANAERGILLRDQTWVALYEYFAQIEGSTVRIPTSAADVFKVLPELTWE